MTTANAFNLLIALSQAQNRVRDLQSHRRDALQTAQAVEDRLDQIATQHTDVAESAWQQFTEANERWQAAGEIDPDEVQTVLLRAANAFTASMEAASDAIAVARTLVGITAQAVVVADGEAEALAQKLALEHALGGTTTALMAQA
jgi:hypothetical protein